MNLHVNRGLARGRGWSSLRWVCSRQQVVSPKASPPSALQLVRRAEEPPPSCWAWLRLLLKLGL